jgi:hypothetical protein
VRLQTEVYRTPNSDPRRRELRKRETAAWDAYHKKWKAVLELGGIPRNRFKRGVLESHSFTCPSPAFVRQCGGWGPGLPIRTVHLDGGSTAEVSRADERLAGCAFLERLLTLGIGPSNWLHGVDFRNARPEDVPTVRPGVVLALARSPHTSRLRYLKFDPVRPSRALFAELAACPQLDRMDLFVGLVPYARWGPLDQTHLLYFSKSRGTPIADAVRELFDGPNAQHLID